MSDYTINADGVTDNTQTPAGKLLSALTMLITTAGCGCMTLLAVGIPLGTWAAIKAIAAM